MIKVLALDQASSMGYALADSDMHILRSGTIKFTGCVGRKLAAVEEWLTELILEERPTHLSFEQPHFRGGASTMLCVGFCAVIQLVAYKFNLPVLSVHTQALKKFATGHGNAEKEDMVRAASEVVGRVLDVKSNNDEADAIHIARWAVHEVMK